MLFSTRKSSVIWRILGAILFFPIALTQIRVTADCPAGTFMENQKCVSCPIGSYTNARNTASKCTLCPKGEYQDLQGASACKACGNQKTTAGTSSTSPNDCSNCVIGHYKSGLSCSPCNYGFYSDAETATQCQPCPEGTYTLVSAATSLQQCVCHQGYHKPTGTQTCVQCDVGFYKNKVGNSEACTPCPTAMSTQNKGATAVMRCVCKKGYYSGSGGCVECPTGQYSDQLNSGQCKTCADRFTTNNAAATSASQCVCMAGHRKQDLLCLPCGVGFYQGLTGQTTCEQCPVLYTTATNTATARSQCKCKQGTKLMNAQCTDCPTSEYQNELGQTSCKACPEGKLTTSTGSVKIADCVCKVGYTQSGPSSGACHACRLGFYKSVTGSGACKQCTPTTRTTANPASTSADQCVHGTCLAGEYGTRTGCVNCLVGSYQPRAGRGKCERCPDHSSTLSTASKAMSDCACDVGYFGTDGVCQQCPSGYFQPNSGRSSCNSCGSQYTVKLAATSSSDCASKPEKYETFRCKFRITSLDWNVVYTDRSASATILLISELTVQLNLLYSHLTNFGTSTGFEFSSGSVVVSNDLLFTDSVSTGSSELERLLKESAKAGNIRGFTIDPQSVSVTQEKWKWYVILGIVIGCLAGIIIITFIVIVCIYICRRERAKNQVPKSSGKKLVPGEVTSTYDNQPIVAEKANMYHTSPLPVKENQYATYARRLPESIQGYTRSEAGSNQMPRSGWYCWKDDHTGLFNTYYQDEDPGLTMTTSYREWAREHVY